MANKIVYNLCHILSELPLTRSILKKDKRRSYPWDFSLCKGFVSRRLLRKKREKTQQHILHIELGHGG